MLRIIKKVLLFMLVFIFSMGPFVKGAIHAAGGPGITVMVEDTAIPLTIRPIEMKGEILLHAKSIFDALKIPFAFEKKWLTVVHQGKTYKVEEGKSRVFTGEQELRLPQPISVRMDACMFRRE